MADEDGNENGNENSGGDDTKETPKQLREKLTAANAKNKELAGKLLVHESGLSHLNPKQIQAVLKMHDEDKDMTPESLKSVAEELGYNTEAPKGNKNEGGDEGNNGQQNQNQDGSQNNNGNQNDLDDDLIVPLNNMEAIERANRAANRQSQGDTDFHTKLMNAKSAEEVEGLIRNEGHKVGIVHEWDVE